MSSNNTVHNFFHLFADITIGSFQLNNLYSFYNTNAKPQKFLLLFIAF